MAVCETLYCHIPFCISKCKYCDFTSFPTSHTDEKMQRYTHILMQQIKYLSAHNFLDDVRFSYIGGGTPTLLGSPLLSDLIGLLRKCLSCLEELTFEANPESLDAKLLKQAEMSGATRVSCGIQTLNEQELVCLGRAHTQKQALDALELISASALDASCDCMCAIPTQTLKSFEQTLSDILVYPLDHISIYSLILEPNTALYQAYKQNEFTEFDDEEQAAFLELAEKMLVHAGFSRYEVANYAKPNKVCQNNFSYWTKKNYLGLGIAATSRFDAQTYAVLQTYIPSLPDLPQEQTIKRVYIRCCSNLEEFLHASALDMLSYEIEFLDEKQTIAEDLMLQARLSQGVSLQTLTDARAVFGKNTIDTILRQLQAAQLGMLDKDGFFVPTHTGWLLGNTIYEVFWNLAEKQVKHICTSPRLR